MSCTCTIQAQILPDEHPVACYHVGVVRPLKSTVSHDGLVVQRGSCAGLACSQATARQLPKGISAAFAFADFAGSCPCLSASVPRGTECCHTSLPGALAALLAHPVRSGRRPGVSAKQQTQQFGGAEVTVKISSSVASARCKYHHPAVGILQCSSKATCCSCLLCSPASSLQFQSPRVEKLFAP